MLDQPNRLARARRSLDETELCSDSEFADEISQIPPGWDEWEAA